MRLGDVFMCCSWVLYIGKHLKVRRNENTRCGMSVGLGDLHRRVSLCARDAAEYRHAPPAISPACGLRPGGTKTGGTGHPLVQWRYTVLVEREGSSPPKMTVRRAIGGPSRCREETSHHVGALRDSSPATSAFHPVLHPSDPLLVPKSWWRV